MRSLVLAAMLCGGCVEYQLARPEVAPIEPLGTPPDGLAQICVFRKGWYGHVWTAVIYDNAHLVGATRGTGGYFCYFAAPGPHALVSQLVVEGGVRARVDLEAVAGERYYLEQTLGATKLARIDASEAAPRLAECEYEALVALPDNRRPPALVQVAPASDRSAIVELRCDLYADDSGRPVRICSPSGARASPAR